MKRCVRWVCGIVGIAALAMPALGATNCVVINNADSGAGSLRQAMLNANASGGGNISFSNVTGQITLASPLPPIIASLNILGPGTDALRVSGNNTNSIFSLAPGTTNTFTGFTMADGYAQQSGSGVGGSPLILRPGCAITNAGTLTVINCNITNCLYVGVGDGGAIVNIGTLAMQNCQFIASGCPRLGEGGGVDGGCIYNASNSYLTLNNCLLTNCAGTLTAGIANDGTATMQNCLLTGLDSGNPDANGTAISSFGQLSLLSCTISNCGGGYWGGAIFSRGPGLVMSNTIITRNDAGEQGGGLFLFGGRNVLYGCTISGNGCNETGGGIENIGDTTMINCTVSGNESGFIGGGGIYNLASLKMTNCTVSGNYLSPGYTRSSGGGILNTTANGDYPPGTNAVLYLTDCTIVSNSASAGTIGGITNQGTVCVQNSIIANNGSNDFAGTLTSLGYNLIGNTNGCTLTNNLTGNIYGVNPLLGPLQFNGGVTMTHALLAGSPAINAGPANAAPFTDQRGLPRPQGSADDIGAFEYGAVPPPAVAALSLGLDGLLHVQFQAIAGFNYTIQRKSSLSGQWTSLGSAVSDCNGCGDCIDAYPPAGSAFYRVAYLTP